MSVVTATLVSVPGTVPGILARLLIPTPSLLADWAIKATVILLLAVAVERILRRESAAVRHLTWTVTVGALLAVPLLSWGLRTHEIELVPEALREVRVRLPAPSAEAGGDRGADPAARPGAPGPVTTEEESRTIRGERGHEGPAAGPGAGSVAAARPPGDSGPGEGAAAASGAGAPGPGGESAAARSGTTWIPDAVSWLPAMWAAGAFLVLLSLLRERIRLAWLVGQARRVEGGPVLDAAARAGRQLGLRDLPELYRGPEGTMPSTWGIFRPRVLLPCEAGSWPDARLESVLAHEFAHVRRRDCAIQTAAVVACALYWFHPLVWLAAIRLKRERELASDDEVVSAGHRPSRYAGELLALAREARRPGSTLTATTVSGRAGLPERLEALVEEGRSRRRAGRRLAVTAAAGATAVLLPLSSVEPFQPVGASLADPTGSSDASVQASECWKPDVPHSMNVHVDGQRHDLRWESAACRAEIRVRGRITFSEDFTSIRTVSSGGMVRLEEESGGLRRVAIFRPSGEGRARLEFRRDGDPWEPGPEDRRWIERQVVTLLRQTGLAAERRVAWLLERGGPDWILAEVGLMTADRGQALYLRELVTGSPLEPEELRRTLEAAGHVGSDGRLSDVLVAIASEYPGAVAGELARAFMDAARGVGSDSHHVRMLEASLEAGGPRLLPVALRSAREGVGSDAHMARFLAHVAARHAGSVTGEQRELFMQALRTVGSDSDHVRTLTMILRERPDDAALLSLALRSARDGVGSDSDMARFLAEVIRGQHALLRSGSLRRDFDAALATVGSDSDEARVRRVLERADRRGG